MGTLVFVSLSEYIDWSTTHVASIYRLRMESAQFYLPLLQPSDCKNLSSKENTESVKNKDFIMNLAVASNLIVSESLLNKYDKKTNKQIPTQSAI